jgi:hypothetical protein
MNQNMHSAKSASCPARGGAIGRALLRIAAWWRGLTRDVAGSYRAERHYMRGPGPKWHENNAGSTT